MPDIFVHSDPVLKKDDVLSDEFPKTELQKKRIRRHHHSKFSAFNLYPDGVDFESREKGEEVVLLLRQHPIVNLKWIFVAFLLLTGPTLLYMFGVFSLLPESFALVVSLAWYLVTMAYAIEGFLGWYFNVYFVTTEGVVDVDFYNIINKRVSDAEMDKIQDVSYSTNGVIGTMFNFGDVFIQTAAEVSEFKFELVPNPEKVAKVLDDLMDEYKARHRRR